MTTQLTHRGEYSAGPAVPTPVPDSVTSAVPRAPTAAHASPRGASGGTSVRIIACYPIRHGLGLYSLAAAIRFCCTACLQQCEATLIAIRVSRVAGGRVVCPSCYAHLGRDGPDGATCVPETRVAAAVCAEDTSSPTRLETRHPGVFAGETGSDH